MDYAKNIMDGLPVDFEVIDVHVHHGQGPDYRLGDPEGDDIVRTMDRLGIDLCCCCGNSAGSDWEYINEHLARSLDKHPDKLRGYVVANPYYGDFDVDHWFQRSKGFIGLKILACLQGNVAIDAPGYGHFYEYADRHDLPVLIHTWVASEVQQALNVAKQYPNAKIILAHCGLTNLSAKMAAIEGLKRYDNVVIDTAISNIYDGALEWIVDKVGADRVLYGSDFITFECSHILGRVAMSRLTDDEKEKIFSLNAKQWLKL